MSSISEENNQPNITTPSLCFSEQDIPYPPQPISNANAPAALPRQEIFAPRVSHQPDETTAQIQVEANDDSCSNARLFTCSEIKFTPSTERLLEKCKTNPAEFLHAIKEAKVVFPTGQGWEAALVTKKENNDLRDLMRIYHRFECYNIYKHVVDAGFHTGTHWVRDRRSELTQKLCQDFPERFQNEKAASKCLNWVDQGCRYHEWTEMFGETADLGYIIALPSEMPNSAYACPTPRGKGQNLTR